MGFPALKEIEPTWQTDSLPRLTRSGRPLVLLAPDECGIGRPRPYLIKNLLDAGQHVGLIGRPGSGKSVLALTLGYMIALGMPVFGRKVQKSPVLYLAAEDGAGTEMRVAALRQRYGAADNFRILAESFNLMDTSCGDLREIKEMIRERRPGLVVLDTLSRSFAGLIENEAESMGEAVCTLRELNEINGATLLTVHHNPKAGGADPRGHGCLGADMDAIWYVSSDRSGERTVAVTKNRHGPEGTTLEFVVTGDRVGEDIDGEAVTAASAILGGEVAIAGPLLDAKSRKAVDELKRLTAEASGPVSLALWEDAIAHLSEAAAPGERNRFARKKAAFLVERGIVSADGNSVFFSEGDDVAYPGSGSVMGGGLKPTPTTHIAKEPMAMPRRGDWR